MQKGWSFLSKRLSLVRFFPAFYAMDVLFVCDLYIARRLIRFASGDIGNANPNALLMAYIVYDTCHKIGMPECEVALVQLAKYLADSKKDNSAYIASQKARAYVKNHGELPVPLHFRNAPTKLMKDLDYGKGYEYDHDLENELPAA